MRILILLFVPIVFLLSFSGYGQTTIAKQDFDSSNSWSFSSDVLFFSHKGTNTLNNVYPQPDGWNGDGFYGIIDIADASGLDYTNLISNVLGERDLDDEGDFGTNGDAITTFTSIDVSSYTNVEVNFDYDIEGYNANGDEAFYEIFHDGVGQGRMTLQTGSTAGDDAQGTETITVPDDLNSIGLKIIVNNDGANGYSGFDNFKVTGTPSDTQVQFTSASGSVAENGGSFDLTLGITNADANIATSVDVALTDGDPSDVDNYTTQTVKFPAGSLANQTVPLTITDNSLSDGNKNLTFSLQNVTGGDNAQAGLQDTFKLTILDDEAPPEGLQINSINSDFIIDFDNTVSGINNGTFNGLGFSPSPNTGQLNSNAWAVTGLSDGDLAFGGTQETQNNDFTRGTSTGGETTGGVYAFDTGSSNFSLGVQPVDSEFTPGTITLKVQNQTGQKINKVDLSYLIYVFNDEERANSLNFSYSEDDATYTKVTALDFTSLEASVTSPAWVSNNKSTSITGLSIADGGFLYLRWTGDDVSGSGSRDEFALDDISVSFNRAYVYDGTNWSPNNPVTGATPSVASNDIVIQNNKAVINGKLTGNNLTVATGATLEMAAPASSTSNATVLNLAGDINNNGRINFKSNEFGTAEFDEFTGSISGSGDVETERYIPATSRSFRYLSSSVDTPGTINDNWQEGAASATADPNPCYGTHITGSSTGANGLDQTSSGNPSLFQWNEGTQVWDTKTTTNDSATDQLIAGDAYAMLIRGDRSASLNSNTAFGPATTLRATGALVTGDVEVGTNIGELAANDTQNVTYSLIGNPYQAQVNMATLLNASSGLNQNFVYIYDPNITDNGGYATVDISDPNNVTVNPTSSEANEFLQPNQAFFVETTAANPTLTFTESIKSTETANVGTFSNTNTTANQFISINLYDDDEQELKDGVRAKFSSDYSNQVNNADAPKLWNDFEWFSLVNDDNYMAIESRALPQQNDTIDLYTGNYLSTNYHFEIDVHEMDYANVQLYDAYHDSYIDLNSGQNSIDFSVDASIPGSVAGNRFQLVFDQVTLGIEDQPEATSLQVYPNPVINKQLHISGLPEFSASSEVDLQLYNMLGQKVYQESISGLKQDQEINLPELIAGNYLLQLTNGEQTQNKHLLVK